MHIPDKVSKITELLIRDYPIVQTPLLHNNEFELLIAVMLSAQTLDATVNKKTPSLFRKYRNVVDLANADIQDVEMIIGGINYYKTKSKNIIATAKKIITNFHGNVPATLEELMSLPGVGRKTANVIIGEWFARPEEFRNRVIERQKDGVVDGLVANNIKPGDLGIPTIIPGYKLPGFVVDTHILRVSKRLGLTTNTTPEKVEQDMMNIFPRDEWTDMALRLLLHGRYRCAAKKPQCYLDEEWSQLCSCVRGN